MTKMDLFFCQKICNDKNTIITINVKTRFENTLL